MSATKAVSVLPNEESSTQIIPHKQDSEKNAYNMRSVSIGGGQLFFNPASSIVALAVLAFIILWTMLDDEEAPHVDAFMKITEWKQWVTVYFTWLYVISQNAWLAVLGYIVWKFGNMKLGQDSDTPEFSDQAYFAMIFSAGIGTGLFFYGVGEPAYHLTGSADFYDSRSAGNSLISEDQKNQDALNITLFHWGILGWVTYTLIAIQLALMSFRHGLPLTMRSTLFPMLGRHTFGWLGDIIDGFTIVVIVAGVVTDLGLGADQIVTGLQRLDLVDVPSDPDDQTARLSCIWIIIAIASVSATTGVERGIKILSQIGVLLSSVLMLGVLFADRTEFLLNLIVQSLGYHFQGIIQMGFACDAWAQLKKFMVIDDTTSPLAFSGRPEKNSAHPLWMDTWTIFYWGWWIAWCPFVGIFLARISKGRTISNVVAYTMTVPFFYILLWFCIFGGSGIRMIRRAMQIQASLADDDPTKNDRCFDVPADAQDPGISPVCLFSTATEFASASTIWFDVLGQYGNIGSFLNGASIVAMIIYFVTSSDSASLVMDALASNGNDTQNPGQRVIWAATQGALASALILKGTGTDLLYAFQPLLVVLGLPYQVIVCLACSGLVKALERDEEYRQPGGIPAYLDSFDKPENGHFKTPVQGYFDHIELGFSLGFPVKSRGYMGVGIASLTRLVMATAAPFLTAHQASLSIGEDLVTATASSGAILFTFGAAILSLLTYWGIGVDEDDNFIGVLALVAYVMHAGLIARLRGEFRNVHGIKDGNSTEDFFTALFFYPIALVQMVEHSNEVPVPVNTNKSL